MFLCVDFALFVIFFSQQFIIYYLLFPTYCSHKEEFNMLGQILQGGFEECPSIERLRHEHLSYLATLFIRSLY